MAASYASAIQTFEPLIFDSLSLELKVGDELGTQEEGAKDRMEC